MEQALTGYVLSTRVFIILLQYFSNIIIPDHDAGVFLHPQESHNYTVVDKFIHHFFGGFVRWDAQYFMHIAKYGYTYENTLAFFPLYPLIVKLVSLVIYLILPWIHLDSILLLMFIGLNVILFLLCANTLFKLTIIIFDEETAYKSTLLFSINPASIFFSAPYAECMFCYLTLQSMLNCIVLYKKYFNTKCRVDCRDILYIWPICLSTVLRSNGILNIGFLAYACLCICKRRWPNTAVSKTKFVITTLFIVGVLTVICLVPFSIYQMYCYHMFCTSRKIEFPSIIIHHAKSNDFVLPGQFLKNNQSWCYNKIPLAYSYVQSNYWNVGFFKYYELKQLPNFLLAAPILVMMITNSCRHIIYNASKNVCDIFSFDILFKKKKHNIISNPILNVFVIHILFLSLFCTLCVHVQISTRMLCSSSPVLYWFCARSFKNRKLVISDIFYNKLSLEEFAIIVYFLSYFIVGTILFCNFLPWT